MRVLSIDPGRRHCAVCLLDAGADPRAEDDRVLAWMLVEINSSKVPDVIESVRGIVAGLPSRPDLVLIEQQVGSNHVMCRVENTMHAFFLMSGAQVAIVCPKRKYAYLAKAGLYKGGFPGGQPGAKLSPYHRKRITALAIEEWVRGGAVVGAPAGRDEALLRYYMDHKKRDDLADALLQAFEHVHWSALLAADRETAPPPEPIGFLALKEKQLIKKKWSPENIMWVLRDHGDSYEDMMAEIGRQGRAMRREIVKWCGHQPNDVNYEHVWRVLRASLAAAAANNRTPSPPPLPSSPPLPSPTIVAAVGDAIAETVRAAFRPPLPPGPAPESRRGPPPDDCPF